MKRIVNSNKKSSSLNYLLLEERRKLIRKMARCPTPEIGLKISDLEGKFGEENIKHLSFENPIYLWLKLCYHTRHNDKIETVEKHSVYIKQCFGALCAEECLSNLYAMVFRIIQ